MNRLLLVLVAALVSSCGSGQSPEQREVARQNRARNDAIWTTRNALNVDGVVFEVAISPDRVYALAAPSTPDTAFTIDGLQKAVVQVSGCSATVDNFLVTFALGGQTNRALTLRNLDNIEKIRAELTC
jgi:hypothetical protein